MFIVYNTNYIKRTTVNEDIPRLWNILPQFYKDIGDRDKFKSNLSTLYQQDYTHS